MNLVMVAHTYSQVETWVLGPLDLLVVVSMAAFVIVHLGKATYNKHNPREHSILYPYYLRQWGLNVSRPIKSFFMKLGLSPNSLTVLGLVCMSIAGLLFGLGFTGAAGWMMGFGGFMDVLDGMIARQTHQASTNGAFIDSTLDRYGDSIIFIGITVFFEHISHLYVILSLIGMMGTLLISYTRARGDSLGIDCKRGLLQRPERIFVIVMGALFDPILHMFGIKLPWGLMISVWIVAIFSHITVLQRIVYISSRLEDLDS